MCGRFTLSEDWSFMLDYFGISDSTYEQPARYNIAPGQEITAIISDGQHRRIGPLKWGLVPYWAKDEKIGYMTMNARAETLAEKPAFKHLIQRKRCLIPADSFYEWKKNGKGKQPMRILLKSRKIFAFAGLYDTWMAPDGSKLNTCTIITTASNELMAEIHHRMPVILDRDSEELWLDKTIQSSQEVLSILRPYPSEDMWVYPVSNLVGNVKNDTPECIAPLEPAL